MFSVNLINEELINQLLREAINEKYNKKYLRGSEPFDIEAWLDLNSNPLIEKRASLERIKYDRKNLSGLLIRAHVDIPDYQGFPYVKVTGDILNYLPLRKYFVIIERNLHGDYYIQPRRSVNEIRVNSVMTMICDKKLSCFDLPFENGSVRFSDWINAREWRRVKGCDAFDVKAEVVKVRKLSGFEELFHGKQDWEIMLFLLYMAGVILFYYMQFVFLKNCGWKLMAWVLSLGMSAMAFGFFYFLHYYKPFPYVSEMPLPLALAIYAFCTIAAMLYAVLLKRKWAVFAVSMVILESLVFLAGLNILGHAGG